MGNLGKIPFVSKFFINQRIKFAKKSIAKTREKIKKLVENQRKKVDSIISEANEIDSIKILNEANALRDRLEEAACVEVDFKEEPAAVTPRGAVTARPTIPRLKPAVSVNVKKKCREYVTTKTRGRVVSAPGRAGWTQQEKELMRDCIKKGGPNGWRP
jgi:cell division septum initiation protein DivIVA